MAAFIAKQMMGDQLKSVKGKRKYATMVELLRGTAGGASAECILHNCGSCCVRDPKVPKFLVGMPG